MYHLLGSVKVSFPATVQLDIILIKHPVPWTDVAIFFLSIPVTGLRGLEGSRFHDTRHMKVVCLSPVRTGRLYPQEYPDTPGHMDLSDASEKIPSDTTGDRSRDLPTSSAAP